MYAKYSHSFCHCPSLDLDVHFAPQFQWDHLIIVRQIFLQDGSENKEGMSTSRDIHL